MIHDMKGLMMATSVLSKHLFVYGEDSESWKPDYNDAMSVRNLEDHISVGLSIWERLKNPSCKTATLDSADLTCEMTDWWREVSEMTVAAVEHFEDKGYTVDGAEQFRESVAEASLMQHAVETWRERIKDIKGGKGIPIEVALDALQNDCPS